MFAIRPVLFAVVLWPAAAHAQFAADVSGWTRNVAQTGTVFYQCAVGGRCRTDDAVSYRVQPDGPPITLERFQQGQDAISRNISAAESPNRVVRIDATPARPLHEAAWTGFGYERVLVRADGSRSAMVSQYLGDGHHRVTFVSTAATVPEANSNLDAIRAAALLVIQLQRP